MNKFKSYTELGKDSVEWWAKALDEEVKNPLTQDESEIFLASTVAEKEMEEDKDGGYSRLLGQWNALSIISRRLALHTFTMSKAAIWACSVLVSTPSEAVIMLNYFQYRCHRRHIKHIDMKSLGLHIIPDGWFSRDILYQFWDKQKFVSPDGALLNMLDYPEYAESIRTIKMEEEL